MNSQTSSEIKVKLRQIDSLYNEVNRKVPTNPAKLHQLLQLSKKYDHPRGQAKATMFLCIYHRNLLAMDSAFYYVKQAEEICTRYKLQVDSVITYGYRGNLYTHMGEPEKALPYFEKSYNGYKQLLLDSTRLKHYNPADLRRFLQINTIQLSDVYLHMGIYDKAKKILKTAIKNPVIDTTSYNYMIMHLYLGGVYKRQEKYDKSAYWFQKGIDINPNDTTLNVLRNQLIWRLCEINISKKDYAKAMNLYNSYQDVVKGWDPDYLLAQLYEGMGKIKKAEKLYVKAIHKKNSHYQKLEQIKRLSDVYIKLKNYKRAIEVRDEYYRLSDSIVIAKNQEKIQNAEIGFKLLEEELKSKQLNTENQLLQSKNEQQKFLLVSTIILTILLAILGWMIWKRYKVVKRIKILEEKENQTLHDHLNVRQSEWSAMIFNQNEKIKELTDIKDSLYNALNTGSEKGLKDVQKSLDKFLKKPNTADLLKKRIESQFPELAFKLKEKHPELSKNDIRHAILIRLGLSLKESAEILNVTPGTVRNSRYRMTQKIKLIENQKIEDYLKEM